MKYIPFSSKSSEFLQNFAKSRRTPQNGDNVSRNSPVLRMTISSGIHDFHQIPLKYHGILQNPHLVSWYSTRKFQGIPGVAGMRPSIPPYDLPTFPAPPGGDPLRFRPPVSQIRPLSRRSPEFSPKFHRIHANSIATHAVLQNALCGP